MTHDAPLSNSVELFDPFDQHVPPATPSHSDILRAIRDLSENQRLIQELLSQQLGELTEIVTGLGAGHRDLQQTHVLLSEELEILKTTVEAHGTRLYEGAAVLDSINEMRGSMSDVFGLLKKLTAVR